MENKIGKLMRFISTVGVHTRWEVRILKRVLRTNTGVILSGKHFKYLLNYFKTILHSGSDPFPMIFSFLYIYIYVTGTQHQGRQT